MDSLQLCASRDLYRLQECLAQEQRYGTQENQQEFHVTIVRVSSFNSLSQIIDVDVNKSSTSRDVTEISLYDRTACKSRLHHLIKNKIIVRLF